MKPYVCNSMLAKKMRKFMKAWSCSQRSLAESAEISHSTVQDILAGHGFKCRTCAKIMDAMGER
jgi:predicted transcriptional regulator